MTRDCDGNLVCRAGARHRSNRARAASLGRDFGVGHGFARWNAAEDLPDPLLERGSPNVERQAESALWLFDETDNLRHDRLEVFVPASEFRLRKAIPQRFGERLGRIAQLNCANPLRRGGHKDAAERALRDCEEDNLAGSSLSERAGLQAEPG